MTALEALRRADAAGLKVEGAQGGIKVRGPKQARAALLPVLAPVAGEILRLLMSTPSAPLLEDRPPCDGCARTNWVVTVVMDDGVRLCPRCWTHGGAP